MGYSSSVTSILLCNSRISVEEKRLPPTPIPELPKLLPFSKKPLKNKSVNINLQKLVGDLETYISVSEVLLILTNLKYI